MITLRWCFAVVPLLVFCSTNLAGGQTSASAPPQRKILTSEPKPSLLGTITYEYYLDARGREVRHGTEIERLSAGGVIRKGFWKDGRRDGAWESYRSNGSVRSRETFVSGRPTGMAQWWNDDGSIQQERKFDASGGLIEESQFYGDGKKMRHGKYSPDTSPSSIFARTPPKRVGTWTYWNRAGEEIAKGEFIDGKPWSGVCGVPAAGDAGSAGGLESFGRYDAGTLVEKVTLKR